MENRPSWETETYSASQVSARILCNPKVHYRVHENPSFAPILSHISPVHVFPTNFFKIRFTKYYPVIYTQLFQAVWYIQWCRPSYVSTSTKSGV